jgi:type II secretory pathway predicted ATPase ExeA
VYRDLAATWRQIAELVQKAAAKMAAQRELPMGAHDRTAWGDEHLRAFEKFVKGRSQLLSLLRVAAERDEQMLASMKAMPSART